MPSRTVPTLRPVPVFRPRFAIDTTTYEDPPMITALVDPVDNVPMWRFEFAETHRQNGVIRTIFTATFILKPVADPHQAAVRRLMIACRDDPEEVARSFFEVVYAQLRLPERLENEENLAQSREEEQQRRAEEDAQVAEAYGLQDALEAHAYSEGWTWNS